MSSPITPSFPAFYRNPACAVGEESWEEGREKMTGYFAPSKNSWNHDIWRLMLACFFYDTFIFCSFPYKPSFFCPPCWQLRRSAHLHFYLCVCCLMFRTPSSLALLLFPIKKKYCKWFYNFGWGRDLKRQGVKMFQRFQLGFQSKVNLAGATNNSHQQCFLAFC